MIRYTVYRGMELVFDISNLKVIWCIKNANCNVIVSRKGESYISERLNRWYKV